MPAPSSTSSARRTAWATSTRATASTATSTPWSTSATRRIRGSSGGSIITCRPFPRRPTRQHFRAHPSAHKFFDPKARELHQVPGASAAPRRSAGTGRAYGELVQWADIIDGAQFESPQGGGRAGRAGAAAHDVGREQPRSQAQAALHRRADDAAAGGDRRRAVRDERAGAGARRRTSAASTSCARARKYERGVVSFDVADDGLDALQQVHPVLPVPRVPLRRRRVADADARQGVGRLEPVAAGAAHGEHRRAVREATAAAAIRWSAPCRCRRRSWRARVRWPTEIAETLRAAAPQERESMPSFDVVSKLDMQEVDNAVNQAKKELGTRYDFRGTATEIEQTPEGHRAALGRQGARVGGLQGADGALGQAQRVAARARSAGAGAGGARARCASSSSSRRGSRRRRARRSSSSSRTPSSRCRRRFRTSRCASPARTATICRRRFACLRANADDIGLDLQYINFRD